MLAVDNETSNLAERYMSVQSYFDGGKQFNRCNATGLRLQNGPHGLKTILKVYHLKSVLNVKFFTGANLILQQKKEHT